VINLKLLMIRTEEHIGLVHTVQLEKLDEKTVRRLIKTSEEVGKLKKGKHKNVSLN
jgi:hypothetical protein